MSFGSKFIKKWLLADWGTGRASRPKTGDWRSQSPKYERLEVSVAQMVPVAQPVAQTAPVAQSQSPMGFQSPKFSPVAPPSRPTWLSRPNMTLSRSIWSPVAHLEPQSLKICLSRPKWLSRSFASRPNESFAYFSRPNDLSRVRQLRLFVFALRDYA